MRVRSVLLNLAITVFLLTFIHGTALAGGCFSTTPSGDCVKWDVDVVWNPEGGGLKGGDGDGEEEGGGACALFPSAHAQSTISNSESNQIVNNAFQTWANVPGASINVTQGPALEDGGNVNAGNIREFWAGAVGGAVGLFDPMGCYDNDQGTPCLRPVLYDNSGLMTDEIAGTCGYCGVFGITAILPERANDSQGTITSSGLRSSEIILSGACVSPAIQNPICGNCCPPDYDLNSLKGTAVHEIGHFLGLDHTLVNPLLYEKCVVGGCGESDLKRIPAMIGFRVPGLDQTTLRQDDESTFAHIYPSGDDCTISGKVTINNGNGRCVEVVVRKETSPGDWQTYAVAQVAGAEVPRNSQGEGCSFDTLVSLIACNNEDHNIFKVPDNCDAAQVGGLANCGQYIIGGLEEGNYKVGAHLFQKNGDASQPILFAIEPCDPVLVKPGLMNQDLIDQTSQPSGGMQNVILTCPAGASVDIDL